jgi:succinate dehydrogenase flavin-adding protein (antitoxin of CptAB toxin-antitoxin module)
MNGSNLDLSLARALALSHEMLDSAEKGNLQSLAALDLERMDLLKFFRNSTRQPSPADQALLHQIAQLNDRTIGLVEHRRRGKGRDLDMAAVGRKAVAAYSSHR